MLAENLKNYTSEVHTELETRLLSHIQSVRDRFDYGSLLKLMHGYYAAVERQLDRFSDIIPDYNERRKADAILSDLRALTFSTSSLPVCEDLPTIDSPAAALGVMYVLEGSTLGGKYIAKMLNKQDASLSVALSFFESYGDRTGEMWLRFKRHLSENTSEAMHLQTRHAAYETFSKFNNWIKKHEPAKL